MPGTERRATGPVGPVASAEISHFFSHLDVYPLVNVNIAMERSTMFNGKIHYKWPFSIAMLVHQRVFIWVCLKMLCTPKPSLVLLIIIPFLNGYFIGNIPYFQTKPYNFEDLFSIFFCMSWIFLNEVPAKSISIGIDWPLTLYWSGTSPN